MFSCIFDALPITFLYNLRSGGIYGTIFQLFASGDYYWTVLLTVTTALAPAYVYKYVERWVAEPPLWCVLAECEMVPSRWNEPGSPISPAEVVRVFLTFPALSVFLIPSLCF